MRHEDVMRSIALLGKEVIPALHEVPLKPYDNRERVDINKELERLWALADNPL